MTIIMTGFLLKGENDWAMHVYDKMIERGLKPSAVYVRCIIPAYAQEGRS